jgi:hypothetical protein
MNHLKNLAGHAISIFLFRFELSGNGIDFVLNQAIAADMDQDVDKKIKPLAHACGETLLRYQHLSVSNTMMDGNLLDTGEFEVMLSKGLGQYFPEVEKQQLFHDAKTIADLLIAVMDRRTKEEKEGKKHTSSDLPPQNPQQIKKELEQLGNKKSLQAELQWLVEGKQVRPGLKRLRLEDLPPDVKASRGYDHRGHCYVFEHETLGELGRIVLINIQAGKTVLQAELFTGQADLASALVQKKKKIFGQIVTIVNTCFDENFPD